MTGRRGWRDAAERIRSRLDEGFLLGEGREALGTTALEARPDVILKMPEDSYTPFWLGLFATLVFAGLLLHAVLVHGGDAARLRGLDHRLAMARARLIQREPQTVRDRGD